MQKYAVLKFVVCIIKIIKINRNKFQLCIRCAESARWMKYKVENSKMPLQQNEQKHK